MYTELRIVKKHVKSDLKIQKDLEKLTFRKATLTKKY